jgi:hypothetical protein
VNEKEKEKDKKKRTGCSVTPRVHEQKGAAS